jgi:hypothetical protein
VNSRVGCWCCGGRYGDTTRDFWRSRDGLLGEFATRFNGSSDRYGARGTAVRGMGMRLVGRSQDRPGRFGGGASRLTDRAPIPSQDMRVFDTC